MKEQKMNEKITINTSEIKKGYTIDMGGGKYYHAFSDAYKHKGVWSFDIDPDYRYGFSSHDTKVIVRKPNK